MNLKRFRKLSAYDREKNKKKDNFNYLNETCCKQGQTVIVGDSITEIINMELFDEYTERTGLHVYNRGISGDTSDRLLERYADNVLSIKPRNIVLLIGTNDLSIKADVDFVFDNIKAIINKTRDSLPSTKIILQAVYPVDYKQKDKNRKIVELNEKLRDFTRLTGVIFVDTHMHLLDQNGGFNEAYTYDGLHPNAKGFSVVSGIITEIL